MTDEARPPLAVDGGTPLRTHPYPDAPALEPAGDAMPVATLEAEVAAFLGVGVEHVRAFGSHEEAYASALRAAGVTGGEVVVPTLLAEGFAAATRDLGARIVPGEVETDTAALSARGLARALSKATSAVVVAHAFGHPAAMAELLAIAKQRGVPIVEDASDALGAAVRGVPVGTLGAAAVFALGSGHALSSGGALLVAPNASTLDGAPMHDADAALALAELRALPATLEARRRLAWELTFNVRGMRAIVGMPHGRWVRHAYDRYVIRLRSLLWKRSLADTIAALRAESVPCEAACGPSLHLDPAVRAALGEDERVAEAWFSAAGRLPDELISIPLHPALTSKDMDQVASALRKIERWST